MQDQPSSVKAFVYIALFLIILGCGQWVIDTTADAILGAPPHTERTAK